MVLPSPNSLLLIGIVTSFATIRRSEAGSIRHEKLFWGSCIQNEQLSRLYGLSIRECITECQLRPACRSINYDIRVRRCDINDVDANLEMILCSKFIYSRKSDWFEVIITHHWNCTGLCLYA